MWAASLTSVAPFRIRRFAPAARGSSGEPGTASTSRPASAASRAVINDPERVAAAKELLSEQFKREKHPPGSPENPLRAESVDDEELTSSFRNEDFGAFLRSKRVSEELRNKDWRTQSKSDDE